MTRPYTCYVNKHSEVSRYMIDDKNVQRTNANKSSNIKICLSKLGLCK